MESSDMLMLVPTRGRPASIAEVVHSWWDTEADCRLTFVVDEDDPALEQYRAEFDRTPTDRWVSLMILGPRRLRLAGALNKAAKVALNRKHSPLAIGFMGDDHRPRTAGWDTRFAECLSGGTGIVYANDLLVGEAFPTAVMMTSDIPASLGYICPPGLVHLCLDLVWRDWGQGLDRITYLHDVVIEHLHPAAQKAALDAGYREANSDDQVAADSAAYYRYRDNLLEADLGTLRKVMT